MLSNQERCNINDCQKSRKIGRGEGNPGQRRKGSCTAFSLALKKLGWEIGKLAESSHRGFGKKRWFVMKGKSNKDSIKTNVKDYISKR